MKKFLALMLAMAMLLALCACNSADTPAPNTDRDATSPAEECRILHQCDLLEKGCRARK